MTMVHVVAAIRTVDVVVLDVASAERALVAVPRDPVEARGGQRDHQQADDCLPHRNSPTAFVRLRRLEHRHHWANCGAENRVTAECDANQIDARFYYSRR